MNETKPPSWRSRLSGIWLVRLVLAVLFFCAGLVLRELLLALVRGGLKLDQAPTIWLGPRAAPEPNLLVANYALIAALVTMLCGYSFYWLYVRWIERRPLSELALPGGLGEFGVGVAVGVLVIGGVIVPLWLLGNFRVVGTGSLFDFVVSGAAGGTAAFMEELALRGIAFRIVEDRFGSWVALVASSSLFGLAHLGNPDSSWWAAITIACTAGLVLGLAYMITRRLWLAVGIHLGVNLLPGAIFGLDVSGAAHPGLLESRLTGPELLTGGGFGLEASPITLVLGLAAATVLLRIAIRRNQVRPFTLSMASRSAAKISL